MKKTSFNICLDTLLELGLDRKSALSAMRHIRKRVRESLLINQQSS